MRLHPAYREKIVDLFTSKLKDVKNAKLYLFGSRADPMRRGGDIDLLLVLPTLELKREWLEMKARLLAELESLGIEQKVDLSICVDDQMKDSPFWRTVTNRILLLET